MWRNKLTYAKCVAFLSCALSISVSEQNRTKTIRQVTDDVTSAAFKTGILNSEPQSLSFMKKYDKRNTSRILFPFAKNLIKAAEHQVMDPTAVHGVTQFSDLDEFERMYTAMVKVEGLKQVSGNGMADVGGGELPEDFDWSEKGAVTGVQMLVTLMF